MKLNEAYENMKQKESEWGKWIEKAVELRSSKLTVGLASSELLAYDSIAKEILQKERLN
uniref:Uncharacterized protein n=1 Tax=viral metagenome TaxID=1070528 RepID=A0A6M3LN00_9ZZZZ